MTRVAIGLGSNLSDRLAQLRLAKAALAALAPVRASSRVYETEPVGGPDQPRYLNAVALVDWEGSLEALLDGLLEIERGMGRVRRERWGPRTIDLDILLAEGIAVHGERLTVPHPHLAERAFALVPLLEVWPDARHPTSGAPYGALEVDRRGVVAIDAPL